MAGCFLHSTTETLVWFLNADVVDRNQRNRTFCDESIASPVSFPEVPSSALDSSDDGKLEADVNNWWSHIVRKSITNPVSTSSGNNVSHSSTSKVESIRDEIIRRWKNLKASRYSTAEDLTTLKLQTMNRFNKKDCVKKTWSWNGKLFALLNHNTKILLRPFQALEDCTVCS